eukprot:COSAG02_NODE_21645_length_780_cov_1.120411_1_plen_53_part_10
MAMRATLLALAIAFNVCVEASHEQKVDGAVAHGENLSPLPPSRGAVIDVHPPS